MLLNLTIVQDFLKNNMFTHSRLLYPYRFHLKNPQLYNGGILQSDYLYVIRAEEFPPLEKDSPSLSLICLGDILPSYETSDIEYICYSKEVNLAQLFNDVLNVFASFQELESRIFQRFTESYTMHDIGEILYEILHNPLSFCTPVLKIEMLVTDQTFPLPEHYAMEEGTYLSLDEHEIVLIDPEYQETLEKTEPDIFSERMYGFRKLYYNLYHQDEYLGRVVMDEIYHPAKKSDLSILLLFSPYLKKAYLDKHSANFGKTRIFNNILENLTIRNEDYVSSNDALLEQEGWKKEYFYLCAIMNVTMVKNYYKKIVDDTIYLHRLFENNCAFTHDNRIIMIVNLGPSSNTAQIYRNMEYFSHKFHYSVGLSNVFRGIEHLNTYYRQAISALETGQSTSPNKSIFKFEDYILDYMTHSLLKEQPKEFYYSERYAHLQAYDKKKGTELVKTLKTSLENNLNATVAQEILHIHRTTYLYRMKRIQEISGIQIQDYKTRLYLMMLMELI